jgi:putative ATP-binding cassette transporter
MAFATIVAALSLIVTQFQSISAYASVITRLGELLEASDEAAWRDISACVKCTYNSDHFIFENLTLRSGDHEDKALLKGLNVSFVAGKRVLVTGANEAGKHALFRASAGLHDVGSGALLRPPMGKVAFLPEQPYVPRSTLRELLVPSGFDKEISNDTVLAVLKDVGLGHVVDKHDGFEEPCDWHELLSFSEEQLLAVARLILSGANFAFFDRPHSALVGETLGRILRLLASRNITCVSFGNGPPQPEHHDCCLELNEDGSWRWTDVV